jgi:hypothetical protein
MFVARGALDLLRKLRHDEFRAQYMRPLLDEARILGIAVDELHSMLDEEEGSRP